MTIEQIRELCSNSKIEVTGHMLERLTQRHILFAEVKEVIMNGEIIEDYPDDYPYPSCLVFGYTVNDRVIHTVVGIGDSKLWLITAYEPEPEQWSEDFRVRKEQS